MSTVDTNKPCMLSPSELRSDPLNHRLNPTKLYYFKVVVGLISLFVKLSIRRMQFIHIEHKFATAAPLTSDASVMTDRARQMAHA